MVAKVRPVLVLSVPFSDKDRALTSVVFHTTTLRSSQFEVKIQVPFLKEGAFVAQSIATYPILHLHRACKKLSAALTLNVTIS
jgi:mRNA interferase MazF